MFSALLRRIGIGSLCLPMLLSVSAIARATVPAASTEKNRIVSMDAGWNAQFLVYADGRAAGWGANKDGQLGDGTLYEQYLPKWSALANVKQAVAAERASYALLRDGTVWQFSSSLGTVSNNIPVEPPTRIEGLSNIAAISAGSDLMVALKNDGTVWTIGNDVQGANRTPQDARIPVQVKGLQHIAAVSAGGYHMMALDRDGQVWTWGYNYYGAIGNGTKDMQFTPHLVAGIGKAKAIAAGTYSSNALLADGSVWNWGRTNGLADIRKKPAKLSALQGAAAISAGGELLALRPDGTVSTVEGKVAGLSHVIRIDAGYALNLAVAKDGTVYSWGGGYAGDGSNHSIFDKPVQVKRPLSFAIHGAPANVGLSPMYRDGMLYVSRSELFKDLGIEVQIDFSAPDPDQYNAVYTTWRFSKGDKTLTYHTRDKQYRIGERIAADAPQPFSVNGNYSNTTMFPLRYLCEKLGVSVSVNAATNTVSLGGSDT
ncbi:stalk domain-containing protein [Cohnella sp. JJ-181]|uniref:RCC1 domain-containing protein n=1 Tax=Cohnella rhizoplanae TaxID=2974897 RepID=UPI0022FF6D3D|nr:stalk domain-containing protein [Cohnella sp. JJ-181]CAI6084097.1 hypothetical protein COHCIP112018_04225 [Cohnella sp. JJ-181]